MCGQEEILITLFWSFRTADMYAAKKQNFVAVPVVAKQSINDFYT